MLQSPRRSCGVNGVAASKPVRGYTFQVGKKGEKQDGVTAGIAHHLVSKMADVLYRVTHFRVIECWNRQLLWELALWIFLERGDSWILAVGVT